MQDLITKLAMFWWLLNSNRQTLPVEFTLPEMKMMLELVSTRNIQIIETM